MGWFGENYLYILSIKYVVGLKLNIWSIWLTDVATYTGGAALIYVRLPYVLLN